ncbi:putative ABC transport system ATP-binding protein [Psychromicrobium silvestre]|uniref:Putative ABC transport system ATP-binding protein n=1 Tax=Psychromicrobium silvestre TaxID=1645614 RepID=A0A7Y9S9L8_9MICC|nr:ABC transporter ATP-binding protein [Psychromicrobium silvestre]NYE96442.1 putative ABC transport system ATP-binding protein [Psychromicrobium silvestre]
MASPRTDTKISDRRDQEILVELEQVTRTVVLPNDEPLHILRGVDLCLRKGDHTAIVGRSGSGKSTLLNLLGLLDLPSSGQLRFVGRDAGNLSERTRAKLRGSAVGFVFQQFNLLPGRSALENVMMPLLYSAGSAFWRRRRLAAEMLEQVGLAERMDTIPALLSGGEQQRVAIARALVRKPQLILADEPTGALDVETGQSVMKLLDGVAAESGAALLTITHDVNIARLARQHYRLDGGVLTEDSSLLQAAEVLA